MKTLRRVLRSTVVAAVAAACGSTSNGEKGVLPQGPPSGQLAALAFDIAGNRLLKAYPHALYQSGDGGRGWEAIPVPPSVQRGRIAAVATSPKVAGTLYIAGPGFGIMRTRDAGQTWQSLNQGLPDLTIEAFATHAELEPTLYAAIAGRGIFRTEDGGSTWRPMDRGPGSEVRQLLHSAMTGSMNTGWLYAATPNGVHRAMDCFCGWRQAGGLPGPSEVYTVVFDPDEPAHLYASGATGVFRSRDGGESWVQLPTQGPVPLALALDPARGVLYAATPDGVIVQSRDEGATWERVSG